jgi:hypothetical protein
MALTKALIPGSNSEARRSTVTKASRFPGLCPRNAIAMSRGAALLSRRRLQLRLGGIAAPLQFQINKTLFVTDDWRSTTALITEKFPLSESIHGPTFLKPAILCDCRKFDRDMETIC